MALKLMGKKYYDYTNDKNQRYTGVKLHCIQELSTPQEGFLTETVSVGSQKPIYYQCDTLPFGSVFTPVYDRYGRIQDIILKSLPEDAPAGKK